MATAQFVFEHRSTKSPLKASIPPGSVNYVASSQAPPIGTTLTGGTRRYFELGTNVELNDFLANIFTSANIVSIAIHEDQDRSRLVLTLGGELGAIIAGRVRVRAFQQVNETKQAGGHSAAMFQNVEDPTLTLETYMALLNAPPVLVPGLVAAIPANNDRAELFTLCCNENGRTWIVVVEVGPAAALLP